MIGRGTFSFPALLQALIERLSQGLSLIFGKSETDPDAFDEVELLRNKVKNILGDNGVLLSPIHPTPPPHHYQSYTKPFNFLYAAMINMMGLPATVIPIGLSQVSQNIVSSLYLSLSPGWTSSKYTDSCWSLQGSPHTGSGL